MKIAVWKVYKPKKDQNSSIIYLNFSITILFQLKCVNYLKLYLIKLKKFGFEYKANPNVTHIIDELSLRIPRRFESVEVNSDLGDKLTKILIFIALNLIERNDSSSIEKLTKMFDKWSFIGRKIMINLNQNHNKLITILKFYICAITAITDIQYLKGITRQIILLVYRTYTNPKLINTEEKNLSVEIIELLQTKYDKE